jgi:hypothetical protein
MNGLAIFKSVAAFKNRDKGKEEKEGVILAGLATVSRMLSPGKKALPRRGEVPGAGSVNHISSQHCPLSILHPSM